MQKMHIVYVVDNLAHISGGTRVITEHVNGLATHGHKIEVWARNMLTPYFPLSVPITLLDINSLNEPDVVVITDMVFIPELASHRRHKRTFLLLQHDSEWTAMVSGTGSYGQFMHEHKQLFTQNWGIIVVSTWLQKIVTQKYGLTSHVVANGVDPQVFHKEEPTVVTKNQKILLYYDPQPWKGFFDAATAVIEVKKHLPTIDVLIIGAFFPQTPPGTRFSFPAIYFNTPEQSALAGIYCSADVFVSASWQEGFGLPGLEALACGTALVTTDAGGAREYATPNKTALVVPPQNTRLLVEAIMQLLDTPALQVTLSNAGQMRATAFTWNKSIHTLAALLAQ